MSSNSDPNSPLTPAKARLTDAEKRQNHIASEKKRRDAIRAGFDKICNIVPDMAGQGRSEAVVLQATVSFMKQQLQKKDRLKQLAMEKGWTEQDFEDVYRTAEQHVKEENQDLERQEERDGHASGGE